MRPKKFSTVEMTVLGMTWLRGPCTTYSVMKELSSSESTYHRSRAGTAYSVMNRLIKLGLIERVEGDLVMVTGEGQDALREWTGPKVPMMDVAHSADLLRLRCFFLAVLAPSDRVEFIEESLLSLKEFEARCLNLIPQNEAIGDYFGALATMCSVLETQARIKWLEQIRDLVAEPIPKDSGWTQMILSRITRT